MQEINNKKYIASVFKEPIFAFFCFPAPHSKETRSSSCDGVRVIKLTKAKIIFRQSLKTSQLRRSFRKESSQLEYGDVDRRHLTVSAASSAIPSINNFITSGNEPGKAIN